MFPLLFIWWNPSQMRMQNRIFRKLHADNFFSKEFLNISNILNLNFWQVKFKFYFKFRFSLFKSRAIIQETIRLRSKDLTWNTVSFSIGVQNKTSDTPKILIVLFSWDGHWIFVPMKMNVEMHHATMNKIVSIQQDLTNVFKKEFVKILSRSGVCHLFLLREEVKLDKYYINFWLNKSSIWKTRFRWIWRNREIW